MGGWAARTHVLPWYLILARHACEAKSHTTPARQQRVNHATQRTRAARDATERPTSVVGRASERVSCRRPMMRVQDEVVAAPQPLRDSPQREAVLAPRVWGRPLRERWDASQRRTLFAVVPRRRQPSELGSAQRQAVHPPRVAFGKVHRWLVLVGHMGPGAWAEMKMPNAALFPGR